MVELSQGKEAVSADQIRKLNTLVDVARNLTSCRSTSVVINKVLTSAMIAIETADAGIFYLYDEAAGMLKVQTAVGFTDQVYALQMKPGESMSGRAFATGQAAFYNNQTEIVQVMGGQSRDNLSAMSKATSGQTFPKSALIAPLKLTGQPIGVIVLDSFTREDAFVASDLNLLQSLADQAAIAIDNVRLYEKQATLVQQLEQALYETEVRGKRDLIDDLLEGKAGTDFERSAKALGIEANIPTVCLWMDLDRFGNYLHEKQMDEAGEAIIQRLKQQLYQALSGIVRAQSPGSFVSLKSDEFIVFLRLDNSSIDPADLRERTMAVATAFQRELKHQHPGLTVSVGIGPVVRGLEALIASLHDVQRMVNLYQRNRQYGRIFFTADLGVDRLLLQIGDTQMLTAFAEETLGSILQTDKSNGNNDLLSTLATYFDSGRNIADTARVTHLHPNTVRYRLDRIKELLDNEDWLGIELSVRICRLTGRL